MLGTKCLRRTKPGAMFFAQVQTFEPVQSLFHCFTVIFAEELACSKQLKIFLLCAISCGCNKHRASEWVTLCFKKCNNSSSNHNNNNNNNNNNDNNNNKENFHK